MRKTNRITIILVLFQIVFIIHSCCTDEYDYKWINAEIEIIDNSGIEPEITDNIEINKKSFGMRITLKDSSFFLTNNLNLFPSCYATSCDQKYTRVHQLLSIRIKTLNMYSSKYLAGTDITQLFMGRMAHEKRKEYVGIDELISTINNTTYNYSSPATFDLYLLDTTSIGGLQTFAVSIELSDDSKLKNQTTQLLFY